MELFIKYYNAYFVFLVNDMASNLHEKSEEDSSDWKEERKKYLEKIKKEDEEMIEKERVLRERLLAAYTEETGEEKFPDRDEKEYPLTVEAVRERIRREAAFRGKLCIFNFI